MDLSKLTTAEKIILGAGIVLIIDLVFLPWHSVDLVIGTYTRSGIESPNSFWGILALLVAIAMVAVVVVTRFTTAKLPDLPMPLPQAMFIAGIVVAALLALKLVSETDALGFGAWLGILLAAAMAYGGYLMRSEAGTASPPMGTADPTL